MKNALCWSIAPWVAALVLVGCGDGSKTDSGTPGPASGGSSSSNAGTHGSTAGDGNGSQNNGGTASGGETGNDGGSSSNGGHPSTGGAGPVLLPDGGLAPVNADAAAGICTAEDPFAGPELRDCDLPGSCGSCMWEKACDQFLFQCAHDADCVCMAECVAQSDVTNTETCLNSCNLTEYPPGFSQWVKLASDMCWDEGCDRLAALPTSTGSVSTAGIGAGNLADCAFDSGLQYDPCAEVWQLQSADGNICLRIDRRNDGPGDNANTIWTLLDVLVGPLGEVCHVTEPTDMCWFAAHHNHADWAHVTCGNRHYDIDIGSRCGEKAAPDAVSVIQLHVFEGPAEATCAPTVDGICQVGEVIDLVPAP
jgi:hypothetical protein